MGCRPWVNQLSGVFIHTVSWRSQRLRIELFVIICMIEFPLLNYTRLVYVFQALNETDQIKSKKAKILIRHIGAFVAIMFRDII